MALNSVITDQSTMIGYLDDFKLMMVLTVLAIPFLLLIKPAKAPADRVTAVLE
jgi:DHA2 family multidrug resistance protein